MSERRDKSVKAPYTAAPLDNRAGVESRIVLVVGSRGRWAPRNALRGFRPRLDTDCGCTTRIAVTSSASPRIPADPENTTQPSGAGTRRDGVDSRRRVLDGRADPPDMHDAVGMQATDDSRPIHRVYVDGFWMDATEVTNEQFAEFVEATGYVTMAERTPTRRSFPARRRRTWSPARSSSRPPPQPVPLDNHFQWWSYVPGADWRHPEGPESSDSRAREVSRSCTSPTTTPWPTRSGPASACRPRPSGSSPRAAAWPASPTPGATSSSPAGSGMANICQGQFPVQGHRRGRLRRHRAGRAVSRPTATASTTWPATSGSGARLVSPRLLRDSGRGRRRRAQSARARRRFDPAEPGEKKRVHRGGSFLCTDQYCTRYMVGTRGKGEVRTGSNHLGFRCVKSPLRHVA